MSGLSCPRPFEHFRRAVHRGDSGIGPCLAENLGAVAGAASEIDHDLRVFRGDAREQIEDGPQAVSGKGKILSGIPTHSAASVFFSFGFQGERVRQQRIGSLAIGEVVDIREDDQFIDIVSVGQFQQLRLDLNRVAQNRAGAVVVDPLLLRRGISIGLCFLDRRHWAVISLIGAQPLQVACLGNAFGVGLGVRADDEDTDIADRFRNAGRRLEFLEICLHDPFAADGIDEMGEGEREAEMRRVGAAVVARPQQPDWRDVLDLRARLDLSERMIGRGRVGEKPAQVLNHIREILGADLRPVGERPRCRKIAARRAADAEIDPAREQSFEQAEIFRDLVGAVVRQHDSAGPDPNMGGFRADSRNHDLRRGAGEAFAAVVFREPIPVIAQGFDMLGQVD